MEDTLNDFRKRQHGIRRKHARMARGYVTKLSRNGVFVQKPDNKSGSILLRLLALCVVGFMVFKIVMLNTLGEERYLELVTQLQTGSSFEQAGSWLMQVDPITAEVTSFVTPYLSAEYSL